MSSVQSIVDDVLRFRDAVTDLSTSFQATLTLMASMPDPYPDKRTPGWYAKYQVRCSGCARFAQVTWSTDGYDHHSGEYSPSWLVECKRCGPGEGFIGER